MKTVMDHEFSSILEDCLQRLHKGQSLEDCLKIYPRQAEALLPLLRAAVRMQHDPKIQPRLEAIQNGRERMLARAKSKFEGRRIERKGSKLAFRLAFSLFVVLLLGSLFTVNASARSLPGDLLYGVKRGWETVRLDLTINTQSRQSLEYQFLVERRDEIQAMIQKGRQGTLELEGVLEAMDNNAWTVSGVKVLLEPQTTIEGVINIGAQLMMQVRVHGNGQVVALKIHFYNKEVASTHTPEASSTPALSSTQEPLRTPESTQAPRTTLEPTSASTQTLMPTDEQEPTNEQDPTDEQEPTIEPGQPGGPTDEQDPTDEPEHIVGPTYDQGLP